MIRVVVEKIIRLTVCARLKRAGYMTALICHYDHVKLCDHQEKE